MSQVQSIEEIRFEGDRLVVDAVVDDMVVRYPQTQFEPAEWGPALCRGTLYFSDEDLIPGGRLTCRRDRILKRSVVCNAPPFFA